MSNHFVQVSDSTSGRSASLPVVSGSVGPEAIDIGKLHKETGLFTYDPGFMSTASCRSAITYIDGDAGILMSRGSPIEQLAKHSNFLEVAYLLMNGELPSAAQFSTFEHEVTHHTMMHEAVKSFLGGFRHDAHPMAMLVGMLGSMASFYHNELDLEDPEQRRMA
ncbi:MAG: citrate (Si)-synthase, partial [Xanthomonadales bacterium]|nr:citrate (Si)-synthase [Xanthomonadales bacterium]